jgi:hypothetical protein
MRRGQWEHEQGSVLLLLQIIRDELSGTCFPSDTIGERHLLVFVLEKPSPRHATRFGLTASSLRLHFSEDLNECSRYPYQAEQNGGRQSADYREHGTASKG